MNIEEVSKTINYLLDNNLRLIEKGQDKIAINIVGPCGCGKSSIIKQIAEQRGAGYTRLNLSELEEIGDLCGVPVKEYIMHKNGEEKWISEKLIDRYINMGWELCEHCEPRMSYAIPSWVPNDPDQEYILNIDDYSRGSSLFMQAIMSLIQFGEYVSWKLPKKCHVLLSSNPDDGSYSVTSLDPAQKSRLINFDVEFDAKVFGKWCDKVGMRDELINFMLLNPEIFDKSAVINARTYTMFANAISGIDNYDTPENLSLISLIAKGCFGDDNEVVSNLFITFIHNHLDKLITPEEILKGEWDKVHKQLKENVYTGTQYRSDIASTLTLRFINYMETFFNKEKDGDDDKKKSEKAINRLTELITCDERLLSEDLIFKLVKTLMYRYPQRLSKLIANPKIKAKILS